MARFRRNSGIRPVNRIKHVVDFQDATPLNVPLDKNLSVTVTNPSLANTNEVEVGSTVNAIYLRVEVVNTGTTGVFGNAYLIVMKNPGNNITLPPANLVGGDDNKKFVIHQEMVMLQFQDNSNPRTLFNGVIVLPRGYRRNGPNDRLQLRVFSPGVELSVCTQCHYKEFR